LTFWTPENIRSSCGGAWLLRPAAANTADKALAGVSTDTRSLRPGQAFIALRGERFDGHRYLDAALDAKSPLLILDDQAAADAILSRARELGAGVVRVTDTGKALLRLAGAYRRTLENTKVVAVAGSNGKTTATRLIHAVLAAAFRGTASAKSFNNAVGVPLTILAASPSDQFLICEVGTNAPGEIAQLASVIEPDIAVITSIGREHLEGFGSIQGVAREEASLLKFLRPGGGGGFAVVTADTPVEAPLTEHLRGITNVVRFGFSPDADLRASDATHAIQSTPEGPALGLRFKINGRTECTLRLLGEHNACNALAAFAVGRRFGIEPPRIIEALASARGPEMRLEPVTVGTGATTAPIIVINDAYNANPDSTLASLSAFADVADALGPGAARRVAVLADMLELGAAAEASHREIGERAGAGLGAGLDLIVLVGEQMDRWARPAIVSLHATPAGAPTVLHFPAADAPDMERIASALMPGDLVLLKGSRRMRLERIVEALASRFTRNAGAPSRSAHPDAACPA
jgi:UDP-N-acetylmuramoyl-tripeptide--D-alanyl-D-alanine ligase